MTIRVQGSHANVQRVLILDGDNSFGPLISLVDLLSVASKAPLHLNFPFRTLSNSAYTCLPWILLLYNRSTGKVRVARVIPLPSPS